MNNKKIVKKRVVSNDQVASNSIVKLPNSLIWLFAILLLGAVPFEGFVVYQAGDYSLSVPLVVVILVLLWMIPITLLRGRIILDRVSLAAFGLTICGFSSGIGVIVQSLEARAYFESLSLTLIWPMVFILFSQRKFSEKELAKFLWFTLCIGTGVAIVGIYQVVSNNLVPGLPRLIFNLTNPITGPQRQWTFGAAGKYLRPTSFFAEPSWFAHFLVPIILLGSMLLTRTRRRMLVMTLLLINFFAFVAAFSLGAYIAMLGTFGVVSLFTDKARRWCFAGGIVTIILLSVAYFLSPPLIHQLLNELITRWYIDVRKGIESFVTSNNAYFLESSGSLRLGTARLGINLWLRTPMTFLFGWGVGEFGNAAQIIGMPPVAFSGTGWTSVLAEQGIIGFFAYSCFLGRFLKSIKTSSEISVTRRPQRKRARVDSVIMKLLAVFLIFSGFTGGLGFERSLRFWIVTTSVNVVRRSVAPTR